MKAIKFPGGKLSRDILWTIGSFAILAASGVVINIAVAALRDAADLGIFNLAYAVYIIASQVAVLGIHYSVLRHAAFYEENPIERGRLLGTGSALALGLGLIAAGIVWAASAGLANLFNSPATGKAIQFATAGLLLFPLNKVLISYLNGLRRMRTFAVLQASRYLLVMFWVTGVAYSELPFAYASFGFFVAEAFTTAACVICLAKTELLRHLGFSLRWARTHLTFGGKSLLSGMFVEMNSRLDVLLLGVFLDERAVGIYSFAAMLVDGLYHILAMVRVNFNPVLVTTVRDHDWRRGRELLCNSRRYGYPITVTLAGLILVAFYFLTHVLIPEKDLVEGTASLLILLIGVTVISAYVPFDNLLLVAGFPGFQTLQNLMIVVANISLNVALVPHLGIAGAAVATSASYLTGIGGLIFLSCRMVGWNLLTNRTPKES